MRLLMELITLAEEYVSKITFKDKQTLEGLGIISLLNVISIPSKL